MMTETKKIVMPIVHLNGTARDELITQRQRAVTALRTAEDRLAQAAPNERDHYLEPGRFELAVDQHKRRIAVLTGLIEEIRAEFRYLDELGR